ncbi:MAG: PaaI family thioesterase [Pseudomonadales bacterium]|nr:PaaI family thioesterase [Pseudomonadales bacterium]
MSNSNYTDMLRKMYPQVPFQKLLGVEVLDAADDYSKVQIKFRPELAGGGDAYHGGVISSLVDLTGALAVWMGHDVEKKGMKASTVSLNVQFLGAALGENIVAEGRCIKRGKELNFCNIEIHGADTNKQVASGSIVYRIAK